MANFSRPHFDLVPQPSRKRRVEVYLCDNLLIGSDELAQSIHDPDRPLAETVVLIPIAAEQEEANLARAMACYAAQKDCHPFIVALLLNHRNALSADRLAKATHTIDEAYRLQARYKDSLDIRIATQQYDEPTIGLIRKNLWDSALLTAFCEGRFDDESGEVIGINHDIDTESIDPRYIANVQNAYAGLQRSMDKNNYSKGVMAPAHTHVRHALPHITHPNTAHGIYWIDTSMDQVADYTGYEEGLVMPFSHYARSGGFKSDATTHETWPFTSNVREIPTITGTDMLTSPRRYIDRFPAHGFVDIWQDGSFSDVDPCRETTGRDATPTELEQHVAGVLNRHLHAFYLRPAIKSAYKQFIRPRAEYIRSDSQIAVFSELSEQLLTSYINTSLQVAWQGLTTIGLQHLIAKAATEIDVASIVTMHIQTLGQEVHDMHTGRQLGD